MHAGVAEKVHQHPVLYFASRNSYPVSRIIPWKLGA